MKKFLGAFLLGLCIGTSTTHAQEDFKPDTGFRSLFNGKDLSGWYYRNTKEKLEGKTESADKRFHVKDGAIVCDLGKGIKDLYTVEEFGNDFVVKMEFRAGLKADSGVYIRGPQLQIRDFIRRGEQKHLKNFKNDDWNVLVITVKGTEATFTLNDEPLKGPDKMKVPAKGGVGLQAETGKFEFRRIQIKTQTAEKPLTRADAQSFVTSQGGDQPAKKRLLLITESKGFVHSVVNRNKKEMCHVEKTFVELAKKFPFFEVDFTQDSRSAISAENLKKYDAVFFYTTGSLPLSDAQKSDLLAFVRSGKGFGGSHCATDTFYNWKEYGELIGAYFDGHPWHEKIRVIVEDKAHPSTKHLGDSFEITDEIYQFKTPYGRDKLHVLMRLDIDSVKKPGKRADKDNALAWVREYGKGRVFYTALGHREEVWNDPRFQQHIIGGLRFLFGMEGSVPVPKK